MKHVFSRHLGEPIPQSEQADSRQVKNNAGGYTFTVDDKVRLERFLILGTEGGTYYSGEKELTKDNANFLKALIERDESLVIETVLEISTTGRAFRNSTAIFAVAALFSYGKVKPSVLVRQVCRTGTHLFEFARYVELLGGWGRAKRRAIAEWYQHKTPDSLAYQVVKYRQRDGWTHQDLFRLSHPMGSFAPGIGEFVLGKPYEGVNHPLIAGFKLIQSQTDVKYVLENLNMWPELPWEAIPTQFLKDPQVWKKLFYNDQLKGQALVRNITRLARIGAFDDMVFARDYATRLTDVTMIQQTKLHPYQYLLAQSVHQHGRWNANQRVKDWSSNPVIMDALNEGFYAAFKYVEPANKRTFIALDVSGSMGYQSPGLDLTSAQVAAAMAMTIARTEPYYQIMGFANVLRDLEISPTMNLNNIMEKTSRMSFGSTDCALPMVHAQQRKLAIDTFVVITDNETWFGSVHPHVALRNYRQAMGIDAKLIVVGVVPTPFTIADPTDRGMLDVVGGDANLPKLITEFSAGQI
jgi:60 kDa SS-A/Ro ribonucleoprotein